MRDLQRELTNYQRSFVEIGRAFMEAQAELPDAISNDEGEATVTLVRQLIVHEGKIDDLALQAAFAALVSLMAGRKHTTPRAIYEELFKTAPDDEWWRDRIARILEEGR